MTRTPALSSPVTRFKWLALFALLAIPVRAADAAEILSRDHTVEVRSTVPAIAGQTVKLYDRTARVEDPSLTAPEPAFNTQSRAEFLAFWDAQKAGPDHFDPRAGQSVWNEMLASDPVGATWGPGVRRAPEVTLGGWGPATAKKVTTPTLLVAAEHDMVIIPQRVRDLHADLGSSRKVLVDLARPSHRSPWERNYMLIFRASLEWLDHGTVNGQANGVVRLGYADK